MMPAAGGKERVLIPEPRAQRRRLRDLVRRQPYRFPHQRARLARALRFIDLATLKELPRPPLAPGVIGGLRMAARKSTEVGFHMSSARSAGDVFSYDVKTSKVTRWTNGNNPGHRHQRVRRAAVDQVEELRRPRDHGLSLPRRRPGSPASAPSSSASTAAPRRSSGPASSGATTTSSTSWAWR